MQEEHNEHNERTVDRRHLLRRAGAVAAGAVGAGVASAVVATPAQAAPGDPVNQGAVNDAGTTQTTLKTNSATNTALRLENATGAPLSLNAIDTAVAVPSIAAPVGSLQADDFGDFYGIGNPDGLGKFLNLLYSPTWATMVIPIDPVRWLDTRFAAGRIHASGAIYDSVGRVQPRNSNTTPDLILDFSDIIAGGFAAVQANVTVVLATAPGFLSLWSAGSFPGTSSINYPTNIAIANFTQTVIDDGLTLKSIRMKTQRPAAVILDIVGFVMSDPFSQFAAGAAAAQALGAQAQRWQKRVPLSR